MRISMTRLCCVGVLGVSAVTVAEPLQAQWLAPLHSVEQILHAYSPELLLSLQSDALWYYAWQVKGVDLAEFMQQAQERIPQLEKAHVQKGSVLWEQSGVTDPCSVRLQTVDQSTAFIALSCLRSAQPVYLPLFSHPDLQLLWAWEEQLSSARVQHQWYSVSKDVEPQAVLAELVAKKFPTLSVHMDSYALSFQHGAEQWVMSWIPMGEQMVGIYVLRCY
ncbi:hypothetical protein ACLPHM_01655 [Paenalcaligenes sp. Me131]|uniref:hypothetical protein n=1 Tax=Paenalcaligenes sp. Me131 TaxID=3392636 RepID=UPI003D28B977